MKNNTNPKDLPASYGYIVTVSSEPNSTDRCPISPIDPEGNYERANAGDVDMAVYPSRQDAEEAVKRAAGDSDPAVYDGIRITSLKHSRNLMAHQRAAYGWVKYPVYAPKRTDYDSQDFTSL